MRKRLLLLIAALGLMLGACTPQEVIYMTFGRGGGGSDALYGQADRVAWCESQHNPNAVNPRSGTSGLFQIHPKYHRTAFTQVTGQPWEKVFDPFWNAVYAKHLYDRLGWQPWVCKP